jgi:hypothetical protein
MKSNSLFDNLSVLFVQSQLSRREQLGAELRRRRFWERAAGESWDLILRSAEFYSVEALGKHLYCRSKFFRVDDCHFPNL